MAKKYDLRTKEGKAAKEREDNVNAVLDGCLKGGIGRIVLFLVGLALLLMCLGEIFPAFGEWMNKIDSL